MTAEVKELQTKILFNAFIRDYGWRIIFNYYLWLIFLSCLLFVAVSMIKFIIILVVIILLLFLLEKSIYKIEVNDKEFFTINYLFRKKRIKPVKIFMKPVEDKQKSVFLKYKTRRGKIKCTIIKGETE